MNSLLAIVRAIDAMVKSAAVVIVGHRTMGNNVLVVISGGHKTVCASLEVGLRRAQSFEVNVIKHVIALPHAETKKVLVMRSSLQRTFSE